MFGYLRIFLTVALLAGISAGIVGWGLHMLGTTPLILEAEVYENAAPAPAEPAVATDGHDHQHDAEAWAPTDGWERNAYSLGAQLITGVG